MSAAAFLPVVVELVAGLVRDGLATAANRDEYERSMVETLKAIKDPTVGSEYFDAREKLLGKSDKADGSGK